MDTAPLVEDQIEDGRKLIEQLVCDGFDVTVAFWVRFQFEEDGPWFYIASKTVDKEGLHAAFRAVHESIHRIRVPWGPWISVSDVGELKLVGVNDPLAKEVRAFRDRYPGRNRFRRPDIAKYRVEELYIYHVKSVDELIRRVFIATLCMGYALQNLPDPSAFHEHGRPKEAERPGAEDDLRNALESLEAALGVQGDDLVKSLSHSGCPAWSREALTKIIRAFALIQKHHPTTDRQAFDLLGQAVWEKQGAEPETHWEREIKDVWPMRPSLNEPTKT